MNKCHTNIGWRNDTTPAINETNLNYMDGCIDTIDDRVVAMDTSKANQSDLLTALSGVTYNTSTGVFTFTWKNGTTATIDLNIEKIPVSFSMDENGVITMITEDGTTYTADVSAILKTYSFTNSSTIGWTVTQNGNNFTVVADVVDGSITANKLQPNYLADVTAQAQAASAAATAASGSASDAADSAEDSEAWAVGQRGGVDVPSTDPAYHNNAKYWKDQAQAIASQTLSGLTDVSIQSPQDGQALVYDATNQEWANADIATDAEDISYDNTSSGLTATNVQDAVDEVNSAMQYLYNMTGGKNLLENQATTQSKSGVTFTVASDGTMQITNTATSNIYFKIYETTNAAEYNSRFLGKTVVLSGTPNSLKSADNRLYAEMNGTKILDEYAFPSATMPVFDTTFSVHLKISSGTSVNYTISPMIRDARIQDDTYVPYAKTNKELTEDVITLTKNTFGTRVSITTGDYICPSDGLFVISANYAQGNYVIGYINGVSAIAACAPSSGNAPTYPRNSVIVRKGMRLNAQSNDFSISYNAAGFIPFN